MTTLPIDRVLDALGEHGLNPRRSGDGWSARCPAHDDRQPSLSVSVGAGDKVVLHCHADCRIDDIVAALGLDLADLFPSSNGDQSARIVATYPYTDEAGTVLYEAVRFSPKAFRQRRPDGRGGWIWNLAGTRHVLYRLPELVAAVTAGHQVWVAEGEKDCRRARARRCGGDV